MTEPQCSKRVFAPGSWIGSRGALCSRRGAVERDGKWYCKQHDPVAKAERQRQKNEEDNARARAEKARFEAAEERCRIIGGAPHYNRPLVGLSEYTGGVLLTAEEADALIARLAEVKP